MGRAKLGVIELCLYFFVWFGAICYSSYHVYLAGKLFDHSVAGDDFSDSWYGFKKDRADYEWTTWLPFILHQLSPWIVFHIAATQLIRWISPILVPAVHCLITCSFLTIHFGPVSTLIALFNVIVYFTIQRCKSVTIVWLFGVPFLLLSCLFLQELWMLTGKSENLYMMMVVGTTWTHLRCVSFSLEQLSTIPALDSQSSARTLYDLLGYTFYLPTYFLGPIILYSNFGPYMYQPYTKSLMVQRMGIFLINLLRYLFWAAVTEGSLYFFYIHALQYQVLTVEQLGEWTLYGLGFLLGQFFCMKYIVVYGLVATVANFDGYVAPPPPKCVARIHLYTDMWRVFDVGYYQFMQKYIYIPLCANSKQMTRRLLASAVCFCYVFLWHGLYLSVAIWSMLNYLGVSIVYFGSFMSKTSAYKSWEKRWLSGPGSRRLEALLCAPVFIMGPVSSFYFFSELTTGNVFANHILFHGSWLSLLSLLFVAYCMCQVSIETKSWEEKSSSKIKQN